MGHFNIGLAIAKRIFQLYGDEHEVYFLVNRGFAEKLQKTCPQVKCLLYAHPSLDVQANLDEYLIHNLEEYGKTLEITDRVEFVNSITNELFEILDDSRLIYPEISEILKKLKPDRE